MYTRSKESVMSSMQRAIGEWKLQCVLYMKFKKAELSFTLRDLFNESALANMDPSTSVILLQNVILGEPFTLNPQVTDNANLDSEYTLNMNPLFEDSFINRFDGILRNIRDTYTGPVNDEVRQMQQTIEFAINEQDKLRKIERIFSILVDYSME